MQAPSSDGELPRSAADIPITVQTQDAMAKPGGGVAVAAAEGFAPTATVSPPTVCVVCQRSFGNHAAVKTFICGHRCHADCADRWLRSELHCPECKNQVIFPLAKPMSFHHPDQHGGVFGTPRPPPFNGTDVRHYGICRDCHEVFYRDPRTIKPETNAWYRCSRCRGFDVINMMRGSCSLQ